MQYKGCSFLSRTHAGRRFKLPGPPDRKIITTRLDLMENSRKKAGRKVKIILLACTTLLISFAAWHIDLIGAAQREFFLYDASSPNKEVSVSHRTSERLNMDFPWLSYSEMPRALNREEYSDYLDLIETFASLMETANVTYAMYFGTLIGSYRMHNMLPWDDDADFIVKFDDMWKVIDVIQQYSKLGTHQGLSFYIMAQRHYDKSYQYRDFQDLNLKDLSPANMFMSFKFFPTSGRVRGNWKWPFLDVYAFTENATDVSIKYDANCMVDLKRDLFYPLVRRPFGRLWLPSPKDSNYSLRAIYKDFEEICDSQGKRHRGRRKRQQRRAVFKCVELRDYYPYVSRVTYPSFTEEHLMFKDDIIHSVRIHI